MSTQFICKSRAAFRTLCHIGNSYQSSCRCISGALDRVGTVNKSEVLQVKNNNSGVNFMSSQINIKFMRNVWTRQYLSVDMKNCGTFFNAKGVDVKVGILRYSSATVGGVDTVKKCEVQEKGELNVGDTVAVNKLVSVGDVDDFCELTGDYNTVHTERRIVHGALLNGLVSSVMGTLLPGPGCIVISQRLEFPHACVAPQCVVVSVTITAARKIVECSFNCRTMDGLEVMRGDARLMRNMPTKKT